MPLFSKSGVEKTVNGTGTKGLRSFFFLCEPRA